MSIKAFKLAEKYRMPAYVMADGVIGQMMESVVLPDPEEFDYDPEWKMGRYVNGEAQVITSIYMEYNDLEALNKRLQAKYREIEKNEQSFEEYMADDAEVLIVAYGICSRIARGVVDAMRADGVKVGLVRPKMVYPFPVVPLKKHVENGTVKAVMSLEMSAGQMIEDVRLAVECKVPVYLQNRMGGNIPSEAEVIEGVNNIFKEIAK